MNKKRILIFIDSFLPGYKAGGPTQSIANFVALFREKFAISVVCRNHDFGESNIYEGIKSNEWEYREDIGIDVYYISDDKVKLKNIKVILQQREFDYLYLNSLWNFSFSFLPLWASQSLKHNFKVILNTRGELNPGAISIKKFKKQVFLKLFKFLNLPKKIRWNATNEIEKKLIHGYFGQQQDVRILSNIPKQKQAAWTALTKKEGEAKFVFLSRISPMKNLEHLLKALQKAKNALHLDIYGPLEDENYWQSCQNLIKQLPEYVKVDYRGQVPAPQVAEILSQYHFFILPTRGENFGHAIFEALLLGKPVLISQNTPWRDLGKKGIGWDIKLDTHETWTKQLEECQQMTSQDYQEWSKNAWRFAHDYKNSPTLVKQAEELFS